MRSWVIQNCFSQKDEKSEQKLSAEDKALANSVFVEIFGNEEKEGKIIFFDAYPLNIPKIELDIMNPHYSEYYNSQKPPGDYYSPIPIFFLVVTNTKFWFHIATKTNKKLSDYKAEDVNTISAKTRNSDSIESILGLGKFWLEDALRFHGIGAKTSVGYGYFK